MKTVTTTVSVVLLLSTLIWIAVYYEFPSEPLKPRETALVVFLVTLITALVQVALKWLGRRRGKETRETQK